MWLSTHFYPISTIQAAVQVALRVVHWDDYRNGWHESVGNNDSAKVA